MGVLLRWLLVSLLAFGHEAETFSVRSAEQQAVVDVPVLGNQTTQTSSSTGYEPSWDIEAMGSGDSALNVNMSQVEEPHIQPEQQPQTPHKPKKSGCLGKMASCRLRKPSKSKPTSCPPHLPSCNPTPTPVTPTPLLPTPVTPTPLLTTPVMPTPTPVMLTPTPTPVTPTPVTPTPVMPTPTPTPVMPMPTPVMPTPTPVTNSSRCPLQQPASKPTQTPVTDAPPCTTTPPHDNPDEASVTQLPTCTSAPPLSAQKQNRPRKPLCPPDQPFCGQSRLRGFPVKRVKYVHQRPHHYIYPTKRRQHPLHFRRSHLKWSHNQGYPLLYSKYQGYPSKWLQHLGYKSQHHGYQVKRPS